MRLGFPKARQALASEEDGLHWLLCEVRTSGHVRCTQPRFLLCVLRGAFAQCAA